MMFGVVLIIKPIVPFNYSCFEYNSFQNWNLIRNRSVWIRELIHVTCNINEIEYMKYYFK